MYSHRVDAWVTSLATRRLAAARAGPQRGCSWAATAGSWTCAPMRTPARPVTLPDGTAARPGPTPTATCTRRRCCTARPPPSCAVPTGPVGSGAGALHRRPRLPAGADRPRAARRGPGQPAARRGARLPVRARPPRARSLDRFIDAFRALFPQVANKVEDSGEPASRRRPQRGRRLALHEAWFTGTIPWGTGELPACGPQRTPSRPSCACSTTRSTPSATCSWPRAFQVVKGPAGAAATLDTLAKGQRPPEPEVAAVPRGGTVLHQRVALLLGDGVPAPGWTGSHPPPGRRRTRGERLAGAAARPANHAPVHRHAGGRPARAGEPRRARPPADRPGHDGPGRRGHRPARPSWTAASPGTSPAAGPDARSPSTTRRPTAAPSPWAALRAGRCGREGARLRGPLTAADLLPPELDQPPPTPSCPRSPTGRRPGRRVTARRPGRRRRGSRWTATSRAAGRAGRGRRVRDQRRPPAQPQHRRPGGAADPGRQRHRARLERPPLRRRGRRQPGRRAHRGVRPRPAGRTPASARPRPSLLGPAWPPRPRLGPEPDATVEGWLAQLARVRQPLDAWRDVQVLGRALGRTVGAGPDRPAAPGARPPTWAALPFVTEAERPPLRTGQPGPARQPPPAARPALGRAAPGHLAGASRPPRRTRGWCSTSTRPGRGPQAVLSRSLRAGPTWSYDAWRPPCWHLRLARSARWTCPASGGYGQLIPMTFLADKATSVPRRSSASFAGLLVADRCRHGRGLRWPGGPASPTGTGSSPARAGPASERGLKPPVRDPLGS